MTDNPCPAVGALIVDGREVAQMRCDLEAGHGVSVGVLDRPESLKLATARLAAGRPMAARPHAFTFTWTDETAVEIPDAALFDPDERFDVEIPDAERST